MPYNTHTGWNKIHRKLYAIQYTYRVEQTTQQVVIYQTIHIEGGTNTKEEVIY